ncbi:dirigent protein 22-like [Primulina huaijiensis]|uniref:dirigent protein 22-like n=1 Tax=Primulina huaijiensis TaxID=1492673 RepID=UPI003CC77168
MKKINLFLFVTLYTLIHASTILCHGPEPVEVWFRNLKKPSVPKTAVIQFYVQDFVGGPRQSAWQVAQASITPTSPTNFGRLIVADSLLTVGTDLNSAPIGRGQGLIGYSDLNDPAVSSSINYVFTSGKYNGSTLSMFGRNPLSAAGDRELSIVGGTGVFRLARGIATVRTYLDFDATGHGVFNYTLYVIYP